MDGGIRLAYSLPAYGLIALAALLSIFNRRDSRSSPSALCLISACLFFGYALIRAINSPSTFLGRNDLFMAIAAVSVYLLTAFRLVSSRLRLVLVAGCLTLGVVQSGIGAIQFFQNGDFTPFSIVQRSGIRASGFYTSPNHLAGFLEVVALFGISVVCWSRWRLGSKMLIGYAALVCLAGLLLTGSRGGYLSVCGGLLAFGCVSSLLLVKTRNPFKFWRAVGAAMLAVGIVGWILSSVLENPTYLRSRFDQVLHDEFRSLLWEEARQQFALNPLIGTGSGTYLYYGPQFRSGKIIAAPSHAHNDYLELLAEYGSVGAITFCFFLLTHLWCGWRWCNQVIPRGHTDRSIRGNSLALKVGALCAVAAFIVHSAFDSNLHVPAHALLLAFVFGIVASPGASVTARTKGVGYCRYLQWSLPAFGLWMVFAGLPLLPGEYFVEESRVASRQGRYVEAIQFAGRGIQYEKTNPYLYFYRASAKCDIANGFDESAVTPEDRAKLFTSALEDYKDSLSLFSRNVYAVVGMALALDGLGRYEESTPLFLKAMELEPNSAQARFYYAAHLHRAGKLSDAKREYEKSLAILPNHWARAGLERLEAETVKEGNLVPGNDPHQEPLIRVP